MRIFIDESGSFIPSTQQVPTVCCVSALVVPESLYSNVLTIHNNCLAQWAPPSAELKGRELNERRFNRIFTALSNLDLVLVIFAVDMAKENEPLLLAHKQGQAERFRKGVAGPQFAQQLKDHVHTLAQRIEDLPTQLYIQASLMSRLLYRTVQTATLHYAQSIPTTLGAFDWVIDAKDHNLTEYERLWSDVVKPISQSMSLEEPLLTISDWDYSAMVSFENPVQEEPPNHLKPGMPRNREPGPFHSVDLKKVYASMNFSNSLDEPGLQLADLTANAFSRACNGRLQERGWNRMGQLMIRDFRMGRYAMEMDTFDTTQPRQSLRLTPYWPVLHELQQGAQSWDQTKG